MNSNDLIGFSGVAILLFAFFFNTIGRISKDHIAYILMNLIGAGVACLASLLINYWPFVVLEAAWALVSLMSLINYLRKS